jgi:hypothetical protein
MARTSVVISLDENDNTVSNVVQFTDAEETARDAEEAQVAQDKADYIANEKYKDDRREAYGDVGDQLDMQYWDRVNDTTVWADHIATVKAAHSKP